MAIASLPRTKKTRITRRTLLGEGLEPRLALTAGSLDTTFNVSGTATTHPGANGFVDEGYSVAAQADGKIVVAGTAWNTGTTQDPSFALVRYNTNGSLDTTFGSGGQVITPVSTGIDQGRIYGMVIEPDQKIVVTGEDGSNMEVARYNTNGSLDTTFGTGGIVTVPHIGQYFTDGKGESIAVQADGKYVIAGYSIALTFRDSWPVVRLNHDGSLDKTFGSVGLSNGPVFAGGSAPEAYDVIVQTDQKIVVAGTSQSSLSTQWQIARYSSTGTLDGTFGTSGVATVTLPTNGQVPFQIVEQPDGKLLIVGSPYENPSESQAGFELMRLNVNGSLDTTFNGGQPIVTSVAGQADSQSFQVALESDGKILLGGHVAAMAGTGVGNFAVQRYNTNGTLDTTFGNAGTAMTSFNETFSNWGLDVSAEQVGMALDPSGNIVMMSEGQQTLNDQSFSWIVSRFSTTATVTSTHPWQDATKPDDVDGDGNITPNDALAIINRLNSVGAGALTGTPGNPPTYYDVDGDGSVTPNDALMVINYLNSQTTAKVATAVSATAPDASGPAAQAASSPAVTATVALGIADAAPAATSTTLATTSGGSSVVSGSADSSNAAGATDAAPAKQSAEANAASQSAALATVYAQADEDDWSAAALGIVDAVDGGSRAGGNRI